MFAKHITNNVGTFRVPNRLFTPEWRTVGLTALLEWDLDETHHAGKEADGTLVSRIFLRGIVLEISIEHGNNFYYKT